MAAKGGKKAQSTNRATPGALNKDSLAVGLGLEKLKRTVTIWPEWSDADINSEKWEPGHKSKEKDRGKSPVRHKDVLGMLLQQQHYFDDPEGKVDMPYGLRVDRWKRPIDFMGCDRVPVVVDPEGYHGFDLLSANEACFESELVRWIVGQIIALWKQSELKNADGTAGVVYIDPSNPSLGEYHHSWRPWEHIYALTRTGKGLNVPAFNPYGKYAVKLYWLGAWRKVIVDDSIPLDDQGQCMLPMTTLQCELWPMILTKALIKVASLDYAGGNQSCEFGDFSVVHCLTSWLPEAIPLQQGHVREIWQLLQDSLPQFKLPEPKPKAEVEPVVGEPAEGMAQEGTVGEKSEVGKDKSVPPEKSDIKKKDDKKKDDKKDKGKDKEKANKSGKKKGNKKPSTTEDQIKVEENRFPEHPEVMVFASYSGPPKFPVRVSVLRDMADASETLRQKGLSHIYPHPVLLTQTRMCPLECPPTPEKIPKWKLIRPKKKKTTPSSDEPFEETEAVEKPIQSLQMTSPFINYKVSPIPIPTDIHRVRSELERGQSRLCSRPGTANVDPIEETDENPPPTPEPEPSQVLPIEPPPAEEPKEEPPKEEKGTSAKGKKKAAQKKIEESEKNEKKPAAAAVKPKKETSAAASGKKNDTSVKKEPAKVVVEEVLGQEEVVEEEEVVRPEPKTTSEDLWMDFDEFCKCFKTLHVYHKWDTYRYNYKHSELKHVHQRESKKSNPNTAAVGADDKSPYYLFVDSLKQTELTVSFTSLSRWPEPPNGTIKEETSKAELKVAKAKDKDKESITVESSSVVEATFVERKPSEAITPGLLLAEPYSWKSLVTGQPILRIRSTGIRSAVLNLPPGRHVLRFNMTAPLGYHYHLCSSTSFVFGDEEKVMAELTKESCRFVENAKQVMQGLHKCIQGFTDPELVKTSWQEFFAVHCPYKDEKHTSKTYHLKVFTEALYTTLKKYLTDANHSSLEMTQAWRSLLFDATSKNPLGISGSSSRPATGGTADRSSAKQKTKKHLAENKSDTWKNREATVEELIAAVKIQSLFRGFRVRKIKAGRTPGTEDNLKVYELLQKAWNVLEPKAEEIGLYLFRTMFKISPEIMPKYPFYKDEWNKISFADYQGNHPDQAPNTWFIVFRDIFYVQEDMLCVPKLYVPIPTCMLRVIDNDTGKEIPRVFQKVAPHIYTKNKKGYTFVAEARTMEQALQAGKWRMRLIGSLSSLPTPIKADTVNSSFYVRELKDYYVPNDNKNILRFTVRSSEDHLVSLQLQTSKPDVYVKLQILDHDEEVLSAVGKGHVVLPAFILQRTGYDPLRPGSRSSTKEKEKDSKERMPKLTIKGRRSNSVTSGHEEPIVERISAQNGEEEEDETKPPPHSYVIQAQVLRDSWPLSESQWLFAQQLKELEKEELKVDFQAQVNSFQELESMFAAKEQPQSPPAKDGRKESKTKDKSKSKGGKDKDKEKSKETGSRPPSQLFDQSKPNWILRIVSDAPAAEELDIKKDTDRADKIRAMKKAWEDAEPGRAIKAVQSRLQYLNSHVIKTGEKSVEPAEGGEPMNDVRTSPTLQSVTVDSDTPLTNIPPPPPPTKDILPPIDLKPFIRKKFSQPVLLDDGQIQQQLEEKQKEIQNYRAYREAVEKRRELDRLDRNNDKVKQLEFCEQMQAALDEARQAINFPREAFRQKYLEAERLRLEEIQAQEAAIRAEMAKSASARGKKSPKGKKSAKGKKK